MDGAYPRFTNKIGTARLTAEYRIPGAMHRVEDVIERSRFITSVSHAQTADDARMFIDAIKREFPDANHNCWAFVAGPAGSTAFVGMSDAGEPHGTAGRPMLDVLIHSDIGEIVAVVTRYFGGTKLGKGGLVRAYGGGVQHALATLPTVLRVERVTLGIEVAYGDVAQLRRSLDENGADVLDEQYGENVTYMVAVPMARRDSLERALVDGTAGRVRITSD